MPRLDSRRLAIAGVALVVLATSGWWGYGAHARWQARKAAIALLQDTAARLGDAVRAQAQVSTAGGTEGVARRDAHLAAAERNHARLRQLDAAALGTLADAADDYLVTGREILRRIAVAGRSQSSLEASTQALRAHMSTDRGGAAWPAEAVRLRERVARDHRDYRFATTTLVKLLDALPASQDKVAGEIGPTRRIDTTTLASARAATLDTAKAIAAEVDKLTDLASYR